MKAITRHVYGPPALTDLDRPAPGPGEALLRVHAACLDHGVWHLGAGLPYPVRLATGLRRPRSPLLGRDVAGSVEAVGPGVTGLAVGDEVFGVCDGALAEHAVAREDRLVRKPAGLSFEAAAAVPTSGLTALQALRDHARVRPGQRVLVIGAGGGVGTFAVQLAKAYGAHVTGVCGPGKGDLVRSLGADEVLDYTRQDPTTGPGRYDVVLDTAGNRSLPGLRRVLTRRGTLVIVGGENASGRWLYGTGRQLRATAMSPFVRHTLRAPIARTDPRDLRHLAGLAASGELTPVVGRAFPLAGFPDAMDHLRSGHVTGKIIMVMPVTE
ncbi:MULTISPECIES: NAD(P)-dependent alcohol dehydrogenase [unclassified Nonomuraea]|uniref:NAD(P)-dependent alcohol dehydrogenase n=1 Tax=unclassified Nonomuraea TaxID=2593643 RepID=UPI0033E7A554